MRLPRLQQPITTMLAALVALGTAAAGLAKWWTGQEAMTPADLTHYLLAAAAAVGLYKARDPA